MSAFLYPKASGIITCMPEKKYLEQAVRDFIIDVCELLHRRGFESAPVGAIMRLMRVPESTAQQHDDHEFLLDEEFERLIESRRQPVPKKVPPGITLH